MEYDKNGKPLSRSFDDYLDECLADPKWAALYLDVCAEDPDPRMLELAKKAVERAKNKENNT